MPCRMSVTPVASHIRTPEGGASNPDPVVGIELLVPEPRRCRYCPHGAATRIAKHVHRQERRRRTRRQDTLTRLAAPSPQQPAADIVPASNLGKAGARLLRLSDNPQLLFQSPTATALNPGDDLHPAACPRPCGPRTSVVRVAKPDQHRKTVLSGQIRCSLASLPYFQRLLCVSSSVAEAEMAEGGGGPDSLSGQVLDSVCLIGPVARRRERLRAFIDASVDLPILMTPAGPDNAHAMIRAIAQLGQIAISDRDWELLSYLTTLFR
jgi:hypothetical protein